MKIEWITPCGDARQNPDGTWDILTANQAGWRVPHLGALAVARLAMSVRLEPGEQIAVGSLSGRLLNPLGEVVNSFQPVPIIEANWGDDLLRTITTIGIQFAAETEGVYSVEISVNDMVEAQASFAIKSASP